jgi:hypothetical protein
MSKPSPIPDIPTELIEQYKRSLAATTDLRLVIILLFSSFEEIMKAFLAWRLACRIDELPRLTASLLFDAVLISESEARRKVKCLSDLRNSVAHKFHLLEFEAKAAAFVGTLANSWPSDEKGRCNVMVVTVFALALEVGDAMMRVPNRSEFPFPELSFALMIPTPP